eukprot:5361803-Pyramimonas_sp.AAC.1
MIDEVRNQQCQWASDILPNKGRKLNFERPFLDGANEGRQRTAHGQVEAKTKPPAGGRVCF